MIVLIRATRRLLDKPTCFAARRREKFVSLFFRPPPREAVALSKICQPAHLLNGPIEIEAKCVLNQSSPEGFHGKLD